MKVRNFEMRILVGDKPIEEYLDSSKRTFVEGRKGSEFVLEFKNHSGNRLLVVPSVDGLSPLDGKPATLDSTGYIVGPWATLKVPGWRLDDGNVARFLFQDKDKSYTRSVTEEGPTQAGVIGMLVYDEEVAQPANTTTVTREVHHHHHIRRVNISQPYVPYWNQPFYVGTPNMTTATTGDAPLLSTSSSVVGASAPTMTSASNAVETPPLESKTDEPFSIGTGWGSKAEFKTNNVTFNRGKLSEQMVIYYDHRRNLEKRGIQVVKRERSYLNDLPSPFTGTGCAPPPGWDG